MPQITAAHVADGESFPAPKAWQRIALECRVLKDLLHCSCRSFVLCNSFAEAAGASAPLPVRLPR